MGRKSTLALRKEVFLMKRVMWFVSAFCIVLLLGGWSMKTARADAAFNAMYRLYNPNSGEHFYTASEGERDAVIKAGWNDEGIGWYAPKTSAVPVYRLYNKNAGDHHYTTNAAERDHLIAVGWNDEGIGWYSDEQKQVPVYRLYNPNAYSAPGRSGAHHYTVSKGENDYLDRIGWNTEGIGWYGVQGTVEAIYLGVENYGAAETNKDNKPSFRYRFQINGKEMIYSIDNGTQDESGEYDYPIQNLLKENYSYRIALEENTVVWAEEIAWEDSAFQPIVSGTPGEKTLKNFLKNAVMPVGTALYIYGGGWDWQDVGSSIQTRTLGVSPDWVRFFNEQDENFTYKGKDGSDENVDPTTSYYPFGAYNEYYYAGLDCSGYLGWVLYNTFETENGKEGYVGGSTGFAKRLAGKGWGTWTQEVSIPDGTKETEMKPGDLMSINGHVWISLGTCADGSVVIAHSTPSNSVTGQPGGGVQISALGTDKNCQAYVLADKVMKNSYPEWSARYETALKDPAVYFAFTGSNAGKFTWTPSAETGLSDPDGIQNMTPEEVIAALYPAA